MVHTRRSASIPQVAVNDYPPERRPKTETRAKSSKSAKASQNEWPTGKQPQGDQELYDYRMWFYKNTLDPHRRIDKMEDRKFRALELAWFDRRTRHAQSIAKKYADLHLREEAFDFAAYDAVCNDWSNKSLESEHLPVFFGIGAFEGPKPKRGHVVKTTAHAHDYGDDEFDPNETTQDDFEVWNDAGPAGANLVDLRDAVVSDLPLTSRPGCFDEAFPDPYPDRRKKGWTRLPWQQTNQTQNEDSSGQLTAIDEEDFRQNVVPSKTNTSRKRKVKEMASNDGVARGNNAKRPKSAQSRPRLGELISQNNDRPSMLFDEYDRVATPIVPSIEGRMIIDGDEEINQDYGDVEFRSDVELDDVDWVEYSDDGSARRR